MLGHSRTSRCMEIGNELEFYNKSHCHLELSESANIILD